VDEERIQAVALQAYFLQIVIKQKSAENYDFCNFDKLNYFYSTE